MLACGWLGWPPDVVLDTPIAQIELALDGKIDFVKSTNPWGSSDKSKAKPAKPDPAAAQQALIAWAERASKKTRPKAKGGDNGK